MDRAKRLITFGSPEREMTLHNLLPIGGDSRHMQEKIMLLKKTSSDLAGSGSAEGLSRRRFLGLAGTGIVAGTLAQIRRAEAKTAKSAARYQDTPNGDKSCSNCKLFIADDNMCRIVAGDISPDGYCRFWVRS